MSIETSVLVYFTMVITNNQEMINYPTTKYIRRFIRWCQRITIFKIFLSLSNHSFCYNFFICGHNITPHNNICDDFKMCPTISSNQSIKYLVSYLSKAPIRTIEKKDNYFVFIESDTCSNKLFSRLSCPI